jgi:hypothetical protein
MEFECPPVSLIFILNCPVARPLKIVSFTYTNSFKILMNNVNKELKIKISKDSDYKIVINPKKTTGNDLDKFQIDIFKMT